MPSRCEISAPCCGASKRYLISLRRIQKCKAIAIVREAAHAVGELDEDVAIWAQAQACLARVLQSVRTRTANEDP